MLNVFRNGLIKTQKPNIMISDDEKAMLTDFGVAKVVDGLRTGLTTVNPTAISLKFSSPEAVAGSDRNVKSDVYSFGCVALGERIYLLQYNFQSLTLLSACIRNHNKQNAVLQSEESTSDYAG